MKGGALADHAREMQFSQRQGQSELKNRRCLNLVCPVHGSIGAGNIVDHGFYRTRSGKRRRYRCVTCGQTFSSTKGTPYYRLQHRRARFDAVVALRVEGVSLSAIARVEGIAWNTVARWLEHAADGCRDFNQSRMAGFVVEELQADEIRSFVGGKTRPTWESLPQPATKLGCSDETRWPHCRRQYQQTCPSGRGTVSTSQADLESVPWLDRAPRPEPTAL